MRLFEYDADLQADRTSAAIKWLAVLAAQLPDDSRVAIAANPENAWKTSDYLLRNIEYQIRAIAWAFAGGEKAGPRPEPIISPGEDAAHVSAVEEAERMAANVAAVLGIN